MTARSTIQARTARASIAGLASTAAAIALHRAIDSYTDGHPGTHAAKALFAPRFRRYAGVALDVYFDHCLARNWRGYSNMAFDEFIGSTYSRLARGLDAPFIPDPMRRMVKAMHAEDWLGAYIEFDGVERALGRLNHAIRHRFAREVDLLPLAGELRRLQQELDAAFAVLFPDVIEHALRMGATTRSTY